MRCRVYPLRRRGRRLPWREVSNAPRFEGDLSTYYLTLKGERYFVAKLVAWGCALQAVTAGTVQARPDEHRERAPGLAGRRRERPRTAGCACSRL